MCKVTTPSLSNTLGATLILPTLTLNPLAYVLSSAALKLLASDAPATNTVPSLLNAKLVPSAGKPASLTILSLELSEIANPCVTCSV